MNNQEPNSIIREAISQDFNLIYVGDFADVYHNEAIFLCVAKSPYMPIEAFRATFDKITEEIEKLGKIEKFIFDKRALRSFHQPSMEWYFTDWKMDLYNKFGLTKHRKILPNEKWFHKCVEAGKHQIYEDHPDLDFTLLDVQYFDSISEATLK